MAPGLFDQQIGVLVFDRSGKGDAHSADSINDLFECTKVNVDVVIDQDAEVVEDRDDEWVGIIAVERTIDSTLGFLAVDTDP